VSPQPRLSQIAQQIAEESKSNQEEVKPQIEMTPQQIEAAEAERDRIAAQLAERSAVFNANTVAPVAPVATLAKSTVANAIAEAVAEMSASEREQRNQAREQRAEEGRRIAQPLLNRIATAKAGIIALRRDHLVHVTELANVDVAAYQRRTPVVRDAEGVDTNHARLAQLVATAKGAVEALAFTFTGVDQAITLMGMVFGEPVESAKYRTTYNTLDNATRSIEGAWGAASSCIRAVAKHEPAVLADVRGVEPVVPPALPEVVRIPVGRTVEAA
jgi:hypothetical protein